MSNTAVAKARCKSHHPDPECEDFACRVVREWLHTKAVDIVNIFQYRSSQRAIDELFGRIRNDKGEGELYDARNRLMVSQGFGA